MIVTLPLDFIDSQFIPSITLGKDYHPFLVALSILIAVVSSFTAFGTSERIQACNTWKQQTPWIFFGAISMGLGIWAMHFIGLLALALPIPVSYDLQITLFSIVPIVIACGMVLWLLNHPSANLKVLLFCGLLLGAGISIMHFSGLAAIEMNAKILHIKSTFILSIIVAIVFSTIALTIQKNATGQDNYQFLNKKLSLSALLMGLAVSGMHYTAMQAIVFVPSENSSHLFSGVEAPLFSAIISLIVLLFLSLALIVPHMHRYKQMAKKLQDNAENLKIAATAFQTQEAIMVTDTDAKIIRVNKAFTRITGYKENDVIGLLPTQLLSEKQDSGQAEIFRTTLINEGKWSGELLGKRKNGEHFPVWQTASAVHDEEKKISHYVSFFSDITEHKRAEQKIEKLAFYDALTGLPNRRLLNERLDHQLNIARRYKKAGILFFLDLDRFKNVNDSLGHSVGDQLLIEIAHRLQSLLRESDTAVRLGGDEFVILLSAQDGIDSDLLEQSKVIAKKIIDSINTPYLIGEHQLYISTSIGIALYSGMDESPELLLKKADTAMYHAKEAGRNTFRFYQQSIQQAVDAKVQIERQLYIAISEGELYLNYQPQLSADNKFLGAEALLRWKNNELGQISPAEFIPVAEQSGLIIPIGQWVIDIVCEQLNSWDRQNIRVPHVAINISAKQFHQADFVSMIMNTVADNQVEPSRLVLEITEGVFLGNIEEAIDKMNALKKIGFSFSIDDFGTGYSSLTYLKRLPFDQLKIDQSFVKGVIDDPSDVAIIKAIVLIANSMNLELIAEGVETDLHLAYLSGFGCNNYQGYFFSKPLSTEQLSAFIQQN